ncbi:MAG: hypothetical protein QOE90_2132 [Thermoplasmata archaeon]|nr:hypothetical protein [Thermoplasmata archaeon]
MTETAEMSPLDAARVLAKARDYEEDLRARTAGITWMIWGFATCGIFLTYGFFSVADAQGWWTSFLWAPWIAAGILATNALWRSASLAMPSLRTLDARSFWLRFALITLAYTLLLFFVHVTGPAQALVFMGVSYGAMTLLGFMSPRRRIQPLGFVVGLLTGGIGLALILAAPGIEVESVVSIAASGLVPFAAGLYQTHRG